MHHYYLAIIIAIMGGCIAACTIASGPYRVAVDSIE